MTSNFNKIIYIFLLPLSLNLFAKDCSELKQTILSKSYLDSDIKELQIGVEANNECMKNLFGIMLYNGIHFPEDQNRAEKIFYDLSEKNYPEAQFNFALTMTKRTDQDPFNVINLISGIFFKYAEDRKVSHLSSLARDLGRRYTESFRDLSNKCNENKYAFNKCDPKLRALTQEDINTLTLKYEETIRDAQVIISNNRIQFAAKSRDQADTLMAILAIGALVYGVSSASNYSGGASAPNIPSGPNPWFNYGQGFGNPLNLYQFGL
jgi:hypothetical protein